MFHCNGWCFPVDDGADRGHQRVPAGSTALIFGLVREHHITILCGAPIVGMLINAPEALRGHRAQTARPDRGCGAAGGGDRGYERIGIESPCLRPDRGSTARGGLRQNGRSGTRCRSRRAQLIAPGRASP